MRALDQAPPASRIDLGEEFEFDLGGMKVVPAELTVAFNGERRELQPRVMQVLVALARARPSVVSRDRLVDLCWGGRIVGDDAVNRVILSLRHLAHEFDPQPFTIETVPRVGHRLIANGDPKKASKRLDRRDVVVGGSAVAIVGALGLAWALRQQDLPREVQPLVADAREAMVDDTVDQLGNATAKLKKATELVPNNADIWGLLALAYGKQVRFATETERNQLVARTLAAARRSLAIEHDQPDARLATILAMPVFRNWLNYERACQHALRTHSAHADLNVTLAGLLGQVGRNAVALGHLKVALDQLPMSPRLHVFRASLLWHLGRLDEAESEIERSFSLWPRHSSIWFTRFFFLMYNGRPSAAVAMYTDVTNRPIGIPDWNFELPALQARALEGSTSLSQEALATSVNSARQGTGFAQNAIAFASAINELDSAFEVLQAYYFGTGFSVGKTYFTKQQGMYRNSWHLDTHFLFSRPMANVRRDLRFRSLLHELGLDEYWRASRTNADVLA